MKWLAPVVVAFFVILFATVFVVAARIVRMTPAAMPSSVTYATYGNTYVPTYGTGPEWDKFKDALGKDDKGEADLQALIGSPDTQVAIAAAQHLAQLDRVSAHRLLFQSLPTASADVKDTFRVYSVPAKTFQSAAGFVDRSMSATDDERKGAILFLKLPYSPDSILSNASNIVFPSLVAAIPQADPAEGDDLAYAIGQYPQMTDIAPLVRLLDEPRPLTREIALKALGKLARADTLGDVQRMLKDSDPAVKSAAKTAEATIKTAMTPPTPTADTSTEAKRAGRAKLGMP